MDVPLLEALVTTHSTDSAYFVFPFTDREVTRFVEVLADHALAEIRCNHTAKSDTAICNCARWAVTRATVQEAKEAWALHVWGVLTGRG